MDARRAVGPDGIAVRLCRVSFVLFKPVLGENAVVLVHQPVAGDLGNDGSAGNGQRLGVPADNGFIPVR